MNEIVSGQPLAQRLSVPCLLALFSGDKHITMAAAFMRKEPDYGRATTALFMNPTPELPTLNP